MSDSMTQKVVTPNDNNSVLVGNTHVIEDPDLDRRVDELVAYYMSKELDLF